MKKISFVILLSIYSIACNTDTKDTTTEKNNTETQTAFPLSNMDTTISPCEDFYQYAIGGWLKDNPVPSTESRWSSFNVVTDSNNTKLKKILVAFSSENHEKGTLEQQVGDFYQSIMDSAKADQLGLNPLKGELKRIDEITKKESIFQLLAHHRSIGVNSILGIYIGQDDKNSEQYITHISQSGLGLPDRDYYLKTDEKSVSIQDAYIKHIAEVFKLANIEEGVNNANTIYEVEKLLATKSMSRVERRDPSKTYNKFLSSELSQLGSTLDWKIYFNNCGLDSVNEVIVSQPNFITAVNHYLDSIPLGNWKIYFKWRLLDSYASELSSDFVNQNFDFYAKTLSGTKEMKPRWKRALSKVNGNIGQLLGKAFVEKHFSEKAKEDVSQMVENLRSVYKERILALEWMSEETKNKAIEKLEAFNKKIGYPDEWRDFSTLEVVPDNQVQNIINARKFNFEYMINKLGKSVDKDEWFMSPQTVNAYYSSSKNEIVFPAGILQPPFYSTEADDALNYGGIGAVIGHEFTHGFDDQGSKYDSKGNLTNWWTGSDRQRFDARSQKVVDQFSSYEPLEGEFLSGELTLGENIADLGGATLAFYALEKELEKKGKPKKIDGFTYQQRFFLGWAQVWHMNMTEEELRKRITTDPHSPGEFRVKGPLANMTEFANAFNCKEGDQMVNSDSTKAVIW